METIMISRIRKSTVIIVIALTFFSYFSAQAEESSSAGSKSSLWRIKSQKNTIYLQGSLHLLKSDNYPLNASIEKAFEDSQILVLEADPRKLRDPETQQMMLTKGMLAQGDSLEDQLSKETYDLAKQKTSELGMDISAFNQLKPWMFSMIITIIELQKLGFNPKHGLDMYFFSKALKAGKQIMGLETIEYQLDLFDSLSAADQGALVRQTLKDLDIIQEKSDSLVEAWSIGDIKRVEAILLKSFREYPTIYGLLITRPNKNWVSRIESFLKQTDNYMIVVGVGHLAGENGLVQLLKRKGYSVEQL